MRGWNRRARQFRQEVEFEGVDANIIRGPAHCDWDDTWMLFVGPDERLVNGDSGDGADPNDGLFVRDPIAVPEYRFESPRDLDRERPGDVLLLGESPEGYELWFSPSDPDYIYLDPADGQEAWVRAADWVLCD